MNYYSDYLKHHGILKQRWGHRNGPPYPLGSGDHSASEKQAAKEAGIKVGKSSGKGSIEKVKKAPLTEEEKRQKAEEAQLKGDSKNITKYMDKLTTEELQDAKTRANIRKDLEGPKEDKVSKRDKEIDDAVKSGNKEKVKEYADKMSYSQLQEAMNKINLMAKLNEVPPKKTTYDKIEEAAKKLDKIRTGLESGLKAYDALAAINNTFNKDNQWPRMKDNNKNDNDKKEDKKNDDVSFDLVKKYVDKAVTEVSNTKKENDQNQKKKEEKAKEKEAKKAEKESKKSEKKTEEESKEGSAHGIKAQPWKEEQKQEKKDYDVTFNKYVSEVDENKSKAIDDKLTANEDAMFRAISNPSAFDSNGNFNWDYYDKERNK